MPDLELRAGELDGLRLHYHATGHGGSAIVMVHGLGGFAESWRHNIEPLASRATVYAIDLPGFGRSAKPPARYRLSDFAKALHGFVETLGLRQVSLVGHSFGAAVAMTYALTHPARVERIAAVGGLVPGCSYRFSWPARLACVQGLGELLALCGCAPLYRASIARCFVAPVAEEVSFLVDSHYAARTGADAKAAFLASVRAAAADLAGHQNDFRRALAGLLLPVLLIHGRQDRVVPAAHCAEASRLLPRSAVRWVDRCGHFPQIEHARTVNAWLAEFLVGRPAPR
jgi:4,5:9,10-diseco-3-hydroxy-5,9,17-trioxoandrosta-1(10),2-diene-4-oate hydrolase